MRTLESEEIRSIFGLRKLKSLVTLEVDVLLFGVLLNYCILSTLC